MNNPIAFVRVTLPIVEINTKSVTFAKGEQKVCLAWESKDCGYNICELRDDGLYVMQPYADAYGLEEKTAPQVPVPDKRITMTPDEWCTLLGVRVIDGDGWRDNSGRKWFDPITREEFLERFKRSTTTVTDAPTFYAWKHLFQ